MGNDHVLTAVAWPYASGPRHIGHVAGFGVPSDVFSRYQRMAGKKVLMVSGTDEHGTPIQVAADKEGLSPRELADRNSLVIAKDLQSLGLSYDLFTRTTTKNHYAIAQEIFLGLLANGYVFPQTQLGAISPSTGRTLPDRYIEGTCPICGYPNARGDQCDNCGNQLDPIDLIDPKQQDQRRDAQVRRDRADDARPAGVRRGAGRLAAKQDPLAPERPEVQLNLLDDLKPRSYTRDLEWGIPVPLDGWRDRTRQVDLRVVRRGRRLPVGVDRVGGKRSGDPEAWRAWWQDSAGHGGQPRGLLLHGQGQHRLPRRDLAGDAVRLLRYRREGRRAGPARAR